VLFATQIIDLKAHLHWKKNALDITGVDKPQIKFWKNPFSNEKEEAGALASLTGTFRVEGTAKIKNNGKIKLRLTLIV